MGGMSQFMSRMVDPALWGALEILVWVVIAIVLILAAAVLFFLFRTERPGSSRGDHRSPVEILEERFARGELSEEDFERRRRELERV